LTDGAVENTNDVIELISKNAIGNRVNTFGIGSGCSIELIRDGAVAGLGHYSFIYDLKLIEKSVIDALSKDFLEYWKVSKIDLVDSNKNVLKNLVDDDFIING
jgi:hypothetical protein